MSSVDVMMKYLNSKYLSSPSLLSDSLKPLRDCKDPWTKNVSISNIQLSLNLFSRLKTVNLDVKIETTHLALFEQKTLMSDHRAKYCEQEVIALREAHEEAIAEETATGRDMVLNLSVRINEAQTKEMIGAKRDFYFKFIEQEVIALRYPVVPGERNSEKKSPKKTVGGEKSFAQKENYEKEGVTSKKYNGRENQ